MRYVAVGILIFIIAVYTTAYAADVTPVLTGNWKLAKVIGGNKEINKVDIGKIVVFKKEGTCQSYMDNFPKDAGYKLYKGYSYATGRTTWMLQFNNTMASDYEVHFVKDTLYLLCSCSEGRHFVFTRTKEMLVLKKDTIAKPPVVVKTVIVNGHSLPRPVGGELAEPHKLVHKTVVVKKPITPAKKAVAPAVKKPVKPAPKAKPAPEVIAN